MDVCIRYAEHQLVGPRLHSVVDPDLKLITADGEISTSSLLFCSLSPYLVRLCGQPQHVDGEPTALSLKQFRQKTVNDLLRLLTTGCVEFASYKSVSDLNELLQCLRFKIRVKKTVLAFKVVSVDAEDDFNITDTVLGEELRSPAARPEKRQIETEEHSNSDELTFKEEESVIDPHIEYVDPEDIDDDPDDLEPETVVVPQRRKKKKTDVKHISVIKEPKTMSMMEVFKSLKLEFEEYMVEDAEVYRCSIASCGKTFKLKFKGNAMAHIFKHLELKPFHCDLCELQFCNIKDLQYHKKTHNKRYKCKHCQKAFPTLSKLTVHTRIHTGEKPFVCDDCGFRTNTQGALSTHQRMHSDEKVQECSYPDCGQRFLYWPQLKRHKELEHGENLDKRYCPICNHKLKTSMDVAKHIRSKHSTQPVKEKEKKFMCPVCGKGWSTELSLNNHMVSHSGEYNYQCDLCPQRCKLKSQLKKHVESIHENVKRHVCDQCGKYFTSRYTLENHSRIHSGEMRYQCGICFEKFGWHKTFSNHQAKVHGIEVVTKKRSTKSHDPTFHCTFPNCGRSFYNNYHYEVHKSKHTTGTSFQCEFCSAEFDKQQKVRDHERKRHKKYRGRKKVEDPGLDQPQVSILKLDSCIGDPPN